MGLLPVGTIWQPDPRSTQPLLNLSDVTDSRQQQVPPSEQRKSPADRGAFVGRTGFEPVTSCV